MERWIVISSILLGILLAGVTTYFLLGDEQCPNQITCTDDAQCGGTVVGERFCREGNVWGNGQVNTCRNAGACEATCDTSYQTLLVEECENGCVSGACS